MAWEGSDRRLIGQTVRDRIARTEPFLAPGAIGVPLAEMVLLHAFPARGVAWIGAALAAAAITSLGLYRYRTGRTSTTGSRLISISMVVQGAGMGATPIAFGLTKTDLVAQAISLSILGFAGVVSAAALAGDRRWGALRFAGMFGPMLVWSVVNRDVRILLTLCLIAAAVILLHEVFTRVAHSVVRTALKNEKLVADLEHANHRLRYETTHDSLTGLTNRRAFNNQLDVELMSDDLFAVSFVDIDNFKAINDRYGHEIGDRVLVEVAERLREFCGDDGVAARRSGDEFTVLQRNDSKLADSDLAKAMHTCVSGSASVNGYDISITCSVGTAIRLAEDSASLMLRRADEALYSAKRSGRNRGMGYSEVQSFDRTAAGE
jgi:diguanylate cyclase (GGDEF)-like protein